MYFFSVDLFSGHTVISNLMSVAPRDWGRGMVGSILAFATAFHRYMHV